MPGMIFYRRKSQEREDATELVVVAVHELNLNVYQKHMYLGELRQIAEAAGAKLVQLPPPPRNPQELYHGEEDVEASCAI